MATIDTINVEILDDISEITVLTLDSTVTSINIDVVNDIDTVTVFEANPAITTIEIEKNYHPVLEVDGLVGIITLSYRETLPTVTASSGIYSYTVNHDLDEELVSVMLYNSSNELVIPEFTIVDSNNVQIESLINISNYKVVVQR